MKQKLDRIFKRARKAIGVGILLVLFALPIFITGLWIKGVVGSNDPRKIVQVEPLEKQSESIKPFDEPLLSITFDDGWESIYSKGLPILQRYNIPTTQYILTGEFDDYNYMSIAQVQSMLNAGHQLGSHTVDHKNLTTISSERVSEELTESNRRIEELFGPIDDFASPHSAFNDPIIQQVKKTYRSHRNTYGDLAELDISDINVRQNFNIYSINAFSVTKDTTIKDLERFIEYGKANNAWIVLCYHQIDDSNKNYSVEPGKFDDQMNFIASAGIKLPTIDQVLDKIQSGAK